MEYGNGGDNMEVVVRGIDDVIGFILAIIDKFPNVTDGMRWSSDGAHYKIKVRFERVLDEGEQKMLEEVIQRFDGYIDE